LFRFFKFHGFGNDYIVIEESALRNVGSLNELVRRVCDRHYGAGADGVVTVRRAEDDTADFVARIFNSDGSEAQISGNGTRCAVAYLYYTDQWSENILRLSTPAGVKQYRLMETISPGHYWFEAELGQPRFDSVSIPMITGDPHERVSNYPLEVDGEIVRVTAVQTGNPHCTIFVDDFDSFDWRRLGSLIETHPAFPQKTNVEFVRVADRQNIDIRIWERGVGETLSSGTCSCGAALASMINDLADRRVKVHTEGGTIEVEWRDDDCIVMSGRADIVYSGEWLAEDTEEN
jgi:diaminopimelate epimerase